MDASEEGLEKTRRMSRKPHPDPEKAKEGVYVDVQFMDYEPITENWSEWKLEDGSMIRAKIILIEVFKPFDPETGDILRRPDGAPQYGAAMTLTHTFEPSESVITTVKAEEG